MKKFLLSMVALLGMGLAASAAEATFDTSNLTNGASGNLVGETITNNGVTIKFVAGDGDYRTTNSGAHIRFYQGESMAVTSTAAVTKIVCTTVANSKGAFEVKKDGTAVGTIEGTGVGAGTITWTGNVTGEFELVAVKQVRFSSIVFTVGEGGSDPNPDPDPTPDAGNLEETFLNGNLGDFTVDNKVVAEGWDGWRANTRTPLCAIANSYVNGDNLAAESWLVSPEVKLGSNASLTFEHAFGFHFPTAQDEFTVVRIQANGGEWEALTMTNFPEKGSGNWTGWAANDFDLSAYNGKTVKVAFCYKNDGNQSVAWEIRNFALKSTSGIADITVDENAPVEYFNLQGVRVANPENGLYIRRQGNKATKVLVK